MPAIQEAVEFERARGRIYAFFSDLLLKPPTAELLDALFTPEVETALEMLFPAHPAVETFRQIGRRHRSGRRQDQDFLLDYESLFRVPGANYVHPFESVYRQQGAPQKKVAKAVLLGPETMEVARIYQEEGLQPREDFAGLPDYLGVELEFAAFLSRKCAVALERGEQEKAKSCNAKRTAFLTEHLLQWSGKCLAGMKQNASTPLYVVLASLIECFLQGEQSETLEAANF